MPLRRICWSVRKQVQRVMYSRHHGFGRQDIASSSCELDGKRQSIELRTERAHGRSVARVQPERGVDGLRASDKQSDRRYIFVLLRISLVEHVRHIQWRNGV